MTLTIPNIESSPTFDAQSVPDSTDWAALTPDVGVITGCTVTAQGSPNMTVAVAAGAVYVGGGGVVVAAVSSLVIGAASASDRKDIVVVNSSGVVSVVAGTACGTAGWTRTSVGLPPVKPAIPASSVLLAEIYVGASTTSIVAGNIVDKTRTPTAPANDPAGWGFASTAPAGYTNSVTGGVWSGPRGRYFRLRQGGTFSKVRINVGTSTGNISIASYPNTGSGLSAGPGARAQTSGVVACPAAGTSDVTLGASDTRATGDWLGLSASGSPTFSVVVSGNANWPDTMGNGEAYDIFGDDPLPANPSFSGHGLMGVVALMKGVP